MSLGPTWAALTRPYLSSKMPKKIYILGHGSSGMNACLTCVRPWVNLYKVAHYKVTY
jgi:hypothetical protein